MKSICTHCGEKIHFNTSLNVWTHNKDRWPDDDGIRCFQKVYNFMADPRPMEWIKRGELIPTNIELFHLIERKYSLEKEVALLRKFLERNNLLAEYDFEKNYRNFCL